MRDVILCKAMKQPKAGPLHICGKVKAHKGRHCCYCGRSWTRKKNTPSGEVCEMWSEVLFAGAKPAPKAVRLGLVPEQGRLIEMD